MGQIKVFRVNDYEWWAGASLDEIKPAYKAECGYEWNDPDSGFDDPYELTSEQMASHQMHEVDEEFDNERDASEPPSFREYLDLLIRKGRKFPRLFASTEW